MYILYYIIHIYYLNIRTSQKYRKSKNPLLCVNVIARQPVEVLEKPVHDDVVRHTKVLVEESSESLPVHLVGRISVILRIHWKLKETLDDQGRNKKQDGPSTGLK